MMFIATSSGSTHKKQGADTPDGTHTSTHHVLPRLGDLPAQPRRNHRAAFLRTAGFPRRIASMDDWDGGPTYGSQPGLVVPVVDGRGKPRSCPHRPLGPWGGSGTAPASGRRTGCRAGVHL